MLPLIPIAIAVIGGGAAWEKFSHSSERHTKRMKNEIETAEAEAREAKIMAAAAKARAAEAEAKLKQAESAKDRN